MQRWPMGAIAQMLIKIPQPAVESWYQPTHKLILINVKSHMCPPKD